MQAHDVHEASTLRCLYVVDHSVLLLFERGVTPWVRLVFHLSYQIDMNIKVDWYSLIEQSLPYISYL